MNRERQVDSAGISDAAAENFVAKETGGWGGLQSSPGSWILEVGARLACGDSGAGHSAFGF